MGRRLFIALPLPDPVRDRVAGLSERARTLRWTPVEQLHITLRFLGDVDEDRTDELRQRLGGIRVGAFTLPVEGIGAFPPRGAPRVLWVGVGSGHPRLQQLRQRVDDVVVNLGIEADLRAFHPHVTLARCGDGADVEAAQWLRRHRDFAGPTFRVDGFDLYASELHAFGAVHTLLERFQLEAGGARSAASP